MLDFREYSRMRRVLYSKPSIIVLFIGVIWMASASYNIHKKSIEAKEKMARAETELAAVQARLTAIDADIDRLSTPHGVEKEIRDRFMVAKEGERIIIVTDGEEKVSHEVVVSDTSDDTSLLGKFKSFVGGE